MRPDARVGLNPEVTCPKCGCTQAKLEALSVLRGTDWKPAQLVRCPNARRRDESQRCQNTWFTDGEEFPLAHVSDELFRIYKAGLKDRLLTPGSVATACGLTAKHISAYFSSTSPAGMSEDRLALIDRVVRGLAAGEKPAPPKPREARAERRRNLEDNRQQRAGDLYWSGVLGGKFRQSEFFKAMGLSASCAGRWFGDREDNTDGALPAEVSPRYLVKALEVLEQLHSDFVEPGKPDVSCEKSLTLLHRKPLTIGKGFFRADEFAEQPCREQSDAPTPPEPNSSAAEDETPEGESEPVTSGASIVDLIGSTFHSFYEYARKQPLIPPYAAEPEASHLVGQVPEVKSDEPQLRPAEAEQAATSPLPQHFEDEAAEMTSQVVAEVLAASPESARGVRLLSSHSVRAEEIAAAIEPQPSEPKPAAVDAPPGDAYDLARQIEGLAAQLAQVDPGLDLLRAIVRRQRRLTRR